MYSTNITSIFKSVLTNNPCLTDTLIICNFCQDTPFCKPGTEVRTIGAMVGSTVKVICEVQSASEEDIIFRWTFNRFVLFL